MPGMTEGANAGPFSRARIADGARVGELDGQLGAVAVHLVGEDR